MPVPRRFDRRPPERDTTRINERIRVPKVRLIGADGEQLGIVEIAEAMKRAQEADLDLVEVAPGSKPPVTRLLDYSKYKYEQEQKQKAARKHQQQVNVREIKLRPKIADHDYETKKGHVERFLRQRNKVKITIMFRGREQAHPERGRNLLAAAVRGPRRAGDDRVRAAAGRAQHEHDAGAQQRGDGGGRQKDEGRRGACPGRGFHLTFSEARLRLSARPRRGKSTRRSIPYRDRPTQHVGDSLCCVAVPEGRRLWGLCRARR